MTALGTLIETPVELSENEYCSGFLDYYDHWESVDPRLTDYHDPLSHLSHAFGHDLVHIATHIREIMNWLQPSHLADPRSVVVVGAWTEAFLTSVRTAVDVLAGGIGYVASKPGQAPTASLRALVNWAEKNQARVRPEVKQVLSQDLSWFRRLRALRDHVIHSGASVTIHTDGHQFNIWVYIPGKGWWTREPLLPLLAMQLRSLIAFSNDAAGAINAVIDFPEDRRNSRVVSGVDIPALHSLVKIEGDYARPSP